MRLVSWLDCWDVAVERDRGRRRLKMGDERDKPHHKKGEENMFGEIDNIVWSWKNELMNCTRGKSP